MRWCVAIWRGIEPTIINNCWRHTKLLNDDNSIRVEVEIEHQNDSEFEMDYIQFVQNIGIQNAMDPSNFLSPTEERVLCTIEELTEEDIIALIQPVEKEEMSPYLNM